MGPNVNMLRETDGTWDNGYTPPGGQDMPPSPPPAPPLPTTFEAAPSRKRCERYIHMDGVVYGGVKLYPPVSLEQCARAVHAFNGQGGCRGEYFFYESAGYCNCPKDDCSVWAPITTWVAVDGSTNSRPAERTPPTTVPCHHVLLSWPHNGADQANSPTKETT
eukprot:332149-Prymnesium_polylepis.2